MQQGCCRDDGDRDPGGDAMRVTLVPRRLAQHASLLPSGRADSTCLTSSASLPNRITHTQRRFDMRTHCKYVRYC